MELLYDETYTSSDGLQTSRNIWYGSLDIVEAGAHGPVIKLCDGLRDFMCETIKNDIKSVDVCPTETNWYFYGPGVTKEHVGGKNLPAIMVREKAGEFIVNISLTDYDFAMSIEKVVLFKKGLLHSLSALI